MPSKRQILSLILLDRYSFQYTSQRQRRRRCLDMWVWKGRQRWGFSQSPHRVAFLGQKQHEQPQGRSVLRLLCLLPRESKGQDVYPMVKSEIQSLPSLWRADQPARINSLSRRPATIRSFLKEGAGSHVAGRQQLGTRILLSWGWWMCIWHH